jgi:4-amino-4-deoxy-L-arabinose transferase-like glycosyltransferase
MSTTNNGSTPAGGAGIAPGRSEKLALAAILVVALLLRVWDLQQNGWGAEYYTAAVRSMAMSWHNFFFAAFDPAGFISVDKPPISLWLQVASVKIFGFHPYSVLLPQVAEGVASVWVLFHLVRRRFGALPALLAALLFAITPIAVAVNRTNNTDSCLVLVLLLAAWALIKAAETGSRRYLLLSMLLIGVGFNVKMLAAFIVLPIFFLSYFVGAPLSWWRKAGDLAIAAVVVAVCSAPWVLSVELTPPEDRPYVGSSSNNSMLELIAGHNAFGRFVKRVNPAAPPTDGQVALGDAVAGAQTSGSPPTGTATPVPGVISRLYVREPVGPLRILHGQLAAQAAWLMPFALLGVALGWRSNGASAPISPGRLNLLFWLGWIVIYAIVYGYAGGIMHFYYLATVAPAIAALAGIGVACLWEKYRSSTTSPLAVAAAILLAALWELYIESGAIDWSPASLAKFPDSTLDWLHAALIFGCVAALLLLPVSVRNAPKTATVPFAAGVFGLGLAALLVVPMAWTLSAVLLPAYGLLPSADLYRAVSERDADERALNRFGQSVDTSRLVRFLNANRSGARYVLATSTTQLAAPIIIETGEAVMARGGFHGLDPAATPESLAAMVEAKTLRFAMLGDVATVSRRMGADAAGKPVADWIRAHGRLVPLPSRRARNLELYDLRPDAGPLHAPSD